jgi:polyhydroxyalkanoate synthesis repressor PhaR
MAILIKRYANRKLYNTETSRYITLKGIAKLLDEGESVQVVDKETGEDITQVALSQILVGNERAKENPSDTLITQILSRGGDALYGALKKSVDDANDGIEDFQDRVRQFVKQSDSAGRGFPWDASENGERRSPFASRAETSDDAVDHDNTDNTGNTGNTKDANGAERAQNSSGSRGWPRMNGLPDFRETIQAAVENAFNNIGGANGDSSSKSGPLGFSAFPRKRDFDALNANLTRVADAIEKLEATIQKQDSNDE